MKLIKYKLCTKVNTGIEEPVWKEVFSTVELGWNKANEETAKREAYNGEYKIYDDGIEEPVKLPSDKERLEALEAAMLEMLGVIAE